MVILKKMHNQVKNEAEKKTTVPLHAQDNIMRSKGGNPVYQENQEFCNCHSWDKKKCIESLLLRK